MPSGKAAAVVSLGGLWIAPLCSVQTLPLACRCPLQMRQNVPKCPGFEDSAGGAASLAACCLVVGCAQGPSASILLHSFAHRGHIDVCSPGEQSTGCHAYLQPTHPSCHLGPLLHTQSRPSPRPRQQQRTPSGKRRSLRSSQQRQRAAAAAAHPPTQRRRQCRN